MVFTTDTALPEVIIIEPDVYRDDRGYFFESYRRELFLENGISVPFVQDNVSVSRHNVLRGLHYQLHRPQGKLVYSVCGEILDVAVDIRQGSPTFGVWTGIVLSSENRRMAYIPEGFAHGFSVLSETAHIVYKCTEYYAPLDEHGIVWDDPSLGIAWPVDEPVLSAKDAALPLLSAIGKEHLPVFDRLDR